MNALPVTIRLVAAAVAASVTFLLLGTVLSIAEPQRSVLLAKMDRTDRSSRAPVTLAMATAAGVVRK